MRVPATPAGYDQPRDFVRSHGRIRMIGIEGTGSYGAGLARALRAAGAPIREVIRPKRSQRRRGKSDPIDAYAAAGRALAEADALPVAKTGTGPCEQIRVLLVERRSAMKARARRPPADHRPAGHRPRRRAHPLRPSQRRGGSSAPWPARAPPRTTHRPRIGDRASAAPPGPPPPDPDRRDRRHRHRAARTDRPRRPDDARHQGAAPSTTATLLAGAGDNPGRIRSEASFAALCGAAPIPASSGRTNRHRLNRGGDRQANWALHQIALVRLAGDPRTKVYAARLTATGKNCKEILRCLKRAIAREAWHLLTHPRPAPRTDDLRRLRHERGLTLTQAAHHLNTHPARISELERGTRPDTTLTAAYRQWLNTQQPQTHTA